MEGQAPTVAVISRHEVVRAGLATMLRAVRPPVRLVDVSASDGHLPALDVVLYDVTGLDERTDDLEHLVASGSHVLGVVHPGRSDLMRAAIEAGVAALVPMGINAEELHETVLAAAAGRNVNVEVNTARERMAPEALGAEPGLTARQVEILELIAAGLSNKEIAVHLMISANTVKSHTRGAYRKLRVTTRAQAVAWVMTHLGS